MELFSIRIRRTFQLVSTSREERRGNFLHLLNALKEKGCDIVVPNPSSRMALICDRFGMELIQHKGEEYMFYNNKIKK